jgi:predicted transcriptional regulator
MQKLAKREEQIMQVLWQLEKAFVKEIIAELPAPKPHYNTVSTIVRILADKGFIAHKTYGNTHQYYPAISKEAYQKKAVGEVMQDVIRNYFDNSVSKMVTHFAKEDKISETELEEIMKMIRDKK